MTDRADLLARLATIVAVDATRRPLTARLCQAGRLLLGSSGASIAVEASGRDRVLLCATDDAAAALEDLQEVLGEGPGYDALLTGQPVRVPLDEQAVQRWPRFTGAARERIGTGVLQSWPMRPGGQVLGVLSVYFASADRGRRSAGRTSVEPTAAPRLAIAPEAAQFLVDAIGAALLQDPLSTKDAAESGAWSGRSQIHQATGMVVAQLHLPVEDALALLRAHAFAHDTTMAELAQQVVERRYDIRRE